jgi:hypothetical protein
MRTIPTILPKSLCRTLCTYVSVVSRICEGRISLALFPDLLEHPVHVAAQEFETTNIAHLGSPALGGCEPGTPPPKSIEAA